MPKPITDELLLEVIDRGLTSIGAGAKQALWYYLEKDFNLPSQNVPKNINNFQESLQKFFGTGYSFLDTLFKQYLQEATNTTFSKSQTFAECVNYLYANKSAKESSINI